MCPEKSSADGEPSRSDEAPTFTSQLKALYEEAGGHKELPLRRLILLAEQHDYTVSKTTLSDWFLNTAPRNPRHVDYVLKVLIPFLEDRATRQHPRRDSTKAGVWSRRLRAAQSASKYAQGGRGARIGKSSRGRLLGGPSRALLDVLPRDFVGREKEAADLAAFVTAAEEAPDYVWLQAGSWAGKTALLAWFVTQELPAGVDVAHYVISGRLGTDRRDAFVQTVTKQLADATGNRRRPPLDPRKPNLDPLYAAAARECEAHGRRLVLVVDGLDEDADASEDDPGIAGLLPKDPPHGMRVIVTGRPYPRVPAKLVADHPLRDPGIVRQLAPSLAAQIIRDMARTELRTLLADREIGQRLLGLLVAARGALTGADLAELIGITPYEVQDRLRTVVGRSLAPTRTDQLPLDIQAEAEAEAGRQTFVLAHAELYETVREALGRRDLAARTQDLHDWALQYEDEGWPEDTPNYLLTGYTHLLHQSGCLERLTALALDPRRQLCLAERCGPDVALAHLDLITPPEADHTPARVQTSTAVLAAAAVSRELLLAHVQPLPRAVAPAIARLGDARRARYLAGTSGSAVDRAQNLAAVARTLQGMDDAQAAATAFEAARWARQALREAGHIGWAADDAEAAAVDVALALLEAPQAPGRRAAPDTASGHQGRAPGSRKPAAVPRRHGEKNDAQQQYTQGIALLRATRGTGSARINGWAQAARLLTPDHPNQAAQLLDELEEQAETLAGEDPANGSAAAGAIAVWETVAGAATDRQARLHSRVLTHATHVWEEAPTLENVAVLAAAASLLAQSRPAQAQQLVTAACRHLEHTLSAGNGRLSEADAFHIEFGFPHTLALLSQALTDAGTPPDAAARALELGHRLIPDDQANQTRRPVGEETDDEPEGRAFAEASKVADEALTLAGKGSPLEAEQRLEHALALLPTASSGSGRAPVWLPDLAGALIQTDAATDAEQLADLAQHHTDQVRLHAAIALAYADSHQPAAALRHAQAASHAATSTTPTDRNWPYAAQALASAGAAEAAINLITLHRQPDTAAGRAAWRKTDRTARIAVATELAIHTPTLTGELLLPVRQHLLATRQGIRSQRQLTALAELLPATTHLPPHQQDQFHTAMENARAHAAHQNPQSWQPEDVLVQAFLHIAAGETPHRHLNWLTHDLANRGPRHFPTAAFAILHASAGDTTTAQQIASQPADPHHRATTLTALASHLARVPQRPSPVPHPIGTDPYTRTIQHLALKTTPTTPPDPHTAIGILHHITATPGWHHTLPLLAHLTPQSIHHIRHIAIAHLHTPGPPH